MGIYLETHVPEYPDETTIKRLVAAMIPYLDAKEANNQWVWWSDYPNWNMAFIGNEARYLVDTFD